MSDNNLVTAQDDSSLQKIELTNLVSDILAEAKKQGADAAEIGASLHTGLSTTVRMGDVDKVEFNRDRGIGITVYFGQRKGSASSSDNSPEAIKNVVTAACNIAKFTSEDEFSGLADAEKMATDFPELDLYHPWCINAQHAIDLATQCEQAALDVDEKIVNSDGGVVSTHNSCRVYGNSHGFIGNKISTRHSISCVVIAQNQEGMQRDYWYTVARDSVDLDSTLQVGRCAGECALRRLDARSISTRQSPVIFSAEIAKGLLSHFLSAISGGSLYRQSSFLLDKLGDIVFPEFINLREEPHMKKGLGSACYDNDGLATYAKDFVRDGRLENYILGAYSARKLNMQSTANAGGVHNLLINTSDYDLPALLKQMDTGLLVTEVSGQGVNIVTGDYSRGAVGFWVERGEIQYPVEGVTIAGNLKNLFQQIVAVGNDVDKRGNIQTGSILIDNMMVAGT